MKRPLAILLFTSPLLFAACGGSAGPTTVAQLSRALHEAGHLEVVLPGELQEEPEGAPRPLRARIELAARTLAERRGVEVDVVEAGAPGSAGSPRIVLGTTQDAGVRELLAVAGAGELEDGRFGWKDCALAEPGDALFACFEDPARPGLPLNLLVTQQVEDLLGLCDDLAPRSRPVLRHTSRSSTVLELPLSVRGNRLRGAGREADGGAWRPVATSQTYGVRRDVAVDPELAESYVQHLDAALATVDSWIGEGPRRFQELLLVGSPALQRAHAGSAGWSVRTSTSSRSFVLVLPGFPGDSGAGAAAEQARAALGEPTAAWMHVGAGIDAAGSWWSRDLRDWGRHLAAAGLLPDPEQLQSAAAVDQLSQHILAPARGLLWRYLRETVSREDLVGAWTGELSLSVDREDFERWVASESSASDGDSGSRSGAAADFWRGVCLASNLRAGGGLDTPELAESLGTARATGANSVSLTSFFSEGLTSSEVPGGALPLGLESLEGDASLAYVLASARSAGIGHVALQPRLVISPSSGYSIWQRLTLLWHWEQFFEAYETFVTHYALLAELGGVDLLVLGSDLSTPQLGEGLAEEVATYREEHLRATLSVARESFGGELCYAASWPGEVQSFRHWDQVDYVGVSWFPFGRERGVSPPSERELRGAWRGQLTSVAKVAEEAGKPWLVCELGVRSTAGGATDTRIGPGRASTLTQSTALAALRGALEDLSRAGRAPAGVFWWRWGARSEADPRGFALTPLSSASLETLVREE